MKKLSECQLYERRISIVNLGVQVHFREEKQKLGQGQAIIGDK